MTEIVNAGVEATVQDKVIHFMWHFLRLYNSLLVMEMFKAAYLGKLGQVGGCRGRLVFRRETL